MTPLHGLLSEVADVESDLWRKKVQFVICLHLLFEKCFTLNDLYVIKEFEFWVVLVTGAMEYQLLTLL